MNPLALLPLLKNPWVLLIIACAIGMGGTGWYRAKYHNLQAANAIAIAEAQRKADTLANELIIAQAAAMAVTERTVVSYVDRIRTVKEPDMACAADPRMRLGSHGVREIIRGQSDPERGAPAAVPGPATRARP